MILRTTTRITRRAPGLDRTIEMEIEGDVRWYVDLPGETREAYVELGPAAPHPHVLSARDVTFEAAPFPCGASWSEFSRAERDDAIEALIEAFEAQQDMEAA